MQFFRDLWERDRAAVIVLIIAVIAILYYVYSQNNATSTTSSTTGNAPNSETPSVVTDQLSTILGALGQLTPVTNTLQPVVTNNTTNNTTTNNAAPLTATLTTPPVTITQSMTAGIGNDTARDVAIKAAEAKYTGPSNAAALQAAIAAILKQYPRSGATT